MITFQSKANQRYVTTNYKVMYSSLHFNDGLKPVRIRKLLAQKVAQRSNIVPSREHYLVVRNPYTRLESFFRNKFRKNIEEPEITAWEHCQRIFLRPLGISPEAPYAEVKHRFLEVSFETFVHIVPHVYLQDAHLVPQSHSETLSVAFLKLPVRYTDVYQMEQAQHLSQLEGQLDIQLGQRLNPTRSQSAPLEWTPTLRHIVATLYKDDFEKYKYPILPTAP